jgi:hypothetical protein
MAQMLSRNRLRRAREGGKSGRAMPGMTIILALFALSVESFLQATGPTST